jgi:hypothetical protein
MQNDSQSTSERKTGKIKLLILLALMLVFLVFLGSAAAQTTEVVPTFSIENVVVDSSVTILAQNFPPFQDFVVTMGKNGTLGINGIPVATTNSGLTGAFSATYPIPDALKGERQIAIRLQSPQGYFSYNWFWNNLAEPAPVPVPLMAIESVIINESVTVRTFNFPAGRTFLVRMGPNGTLGIDGTPVGTIDSGIGGSFQASFPIPESLKGLERIAIRAESGPFFAYNWFDNQPVEVIQTPTFRVCGVVRDTSVTIRTDPTFRPNRNFIVMMNFMGTLGTDGYVVGTLNTGPTGVVSGTYPIPVGLQGLDQITIRTEEVGGPFFSYNYFNNQTATFCTP